MDIGRLMFSLQPTSFLNEAAIVPLEAADLLAWAGFGKRTSGSPASDRSHWSISEDVSQFGGILEASLFGLLRAHRPRLPLSANEQQVNGSRTGRRLPSQWTSILSKQRRS